MLIIVLGGGAAGFFAAITAKDYHPSAAVVLLERTSQLLGKVRISGGGRCNVTHSCFEPRRLVQNYPRGNKELLGPFHQFGPEQTIEWFGSRGVKLKTESDGRMFPTTDSSQTIIDCLMKEAEKVGVKIQLGKKIESVSREGEQFVLQAGNEILKCDRLILATGSNPAGHAFAQSLGHTIQKPVPSLFTFNVPDFSLKELAGATVEKAVLSIEGFPRQQEGALLVTHWGFSGPAALKLSAWAARFLFEREYEANLQIDWIPDTGDRQFFEIFKTLRKDSGARSLTNVKPFPLSKNLWRKFLEDVRIDPSLQLSHLAQDDIARLHRKLKGDLYRIKGKTTNKEEFVTCGGVSLAEVNFKTMESRLQPGLFFAGEILDIDGVTGGFNFQNAWTTGWLAGQ